MKNSESPPPIPPLHRSLSDPTAASEFRPPAAPTLPPRPSVAPQTIIKSPSRSSAQESPNTKRLKRMKDRLRQMRQWWDQVLQEEEDSNAAEDNNSKEEEKGEEAKTSSSTAAEELVWVEEKAREEKSVQVAEHGES